jgi:N4-gp56 family major capsid protein
MQVQVTSSMGGYGSVPKLSKAFRLAAAPMYIFRQFCTVKEAIGLRNGDKKFFDKFSRIVTGGGIVAETVTVGNDSYTIVQDSVTVNDYANAIPWTEDLEKSSEFDVNNNLHVIIRDDIQNTYDKAVSSIAVSSKLIGIATATARGGIVWTSSGTNTNTSAINLSDRNVMDVIDYMKKKLMPRYQGGKDYIGIVSITAQASLHDCLTPFMQYTTPEFLYNAENGRFYNCRFVECDSGLLSEAKSECVFMGGDAMWEAIVFPEEIRFDPISDLGRNKRMGWVGRQGFKKVWDWSTDSEEHMVRVKITA